MKGNDSAAAAIRAEKDNWNGIEIAAWKAEHPDITLGWQPGCDCDAKAVPCMVLDMFAGSGTVGVVCQQFGRNFHGCDLNPAYCKMARKRWQS
jgi:hypothetical protein